MRPLPIVAGPERATNDRAPGPDHLPDLSVDALFPLMEAFYERVTVDPLLGRYFDDVDMRAHMPRIVDFWSTIVFHTGAFSGNAFAPHMKMPGLAAEHFDRWVETFERNMDERHAGPHAEFAKQLAHRIAFSMQLRLGVMAREQQADSPQPPNE